MSALGDFLRARFAEDEEKIEWSAAETYLLGRANLKTRLLADLEAKLRLLGYAEFILQAWEDKSAYPDMNRRERHTANVILGCLALPYADHPDLREEWGL